ncbi:MAG: tripartite tricarboxylate transporter substrate-binding protein [Burkholderiales bacterium]|nr:tripartite tricarboxylate transporter substrate-binding protein [Burkholderiales bacterium]
MSNNGRAWHPDHEIELVAGTPAGGGQDRPARALIRILQSRKLIDVPIKLTNIPGKGGGNGWDYLRCHAGDPHVLAINSPTLITNRQLGVADFDHAALTPLASLYTEYIAFVVRADSPIQTCADFMARLARDTASCRIALATAIGNINHMALAQVTAHAGGDVRGLKLNVFDSALYAVADVIEKRAEVAAITAVSAAAAIAAGQVRALAVSAPQRLPRLYANVPTWSELGVNCVIGTWRGVIGAAGLAPAQIAFWDGALRAATATDDWHAELAEKYWADTYVGGAALTAFLDREREVMAAVLGELGLVQPAS